ncbi:hypothetical protein [Hyphomicrobium sp.]|uniref:hypothetical protein n=1 Tax=Hyphomicrobium sp. TaxID=82 RepID=UPI000F960889|nr:hypothetical protein [Hyphomicrobium sp.]RUO98460.1 MAG: hypothetical protein EKK30_11645 [Hyphomicrobium sp.]
MFKVLEKQGGEIREDRKELIWTVQSETIRFQLREKQKQVRRQMDKNERWLSTNGWRQELVPTGTLAFSIKHLPRNLRREWAETQKKRMEVLLPDIVATFAAAVPLLVEQRREQEEQQRQWKLDEIRRHEERQAIALDANRWRKFVEFSQQSREAEHLRAFLDSIKAKCIDWERQVAGLTVADWITWAERRLLKTDPLHQGVENMFEAIGRLNAWDVRT